MLTCYFIYLWRTSLNKFIRSNQFQKPRSVMINTVRAPLCGDNNSVVIELQCTMGERRRRRKKKPVELCLIVPWRGQRGRCDWLLPPEAAGLSGLLGVTPRWLYKVLAQQCRALQRPGHQPESSLWPHPAVRHQHQHQHHIGTLQWWLQRQSFQAGRSTRRTSACCSISATWPTSTPRHGFPPALCTRSPGGTQTSRWTNLRPWVNSPTACPPPQRRTPTRRQRAARWATSAPRDTGASRPTPGRGGGCTAWTRRSTSWGASSPPWKTRGSCPSMTPSKWRRSTSPSCRSSWQAWFARSAGVQTRPPGGIWFSPCSPRTSWLGTSGTPAPPWATS